LKQLQEATHREYCDWDLRVQDLRGMETIQYLLHDVQQCRELARMLQLRARHQILTGHPDEALETLQMGYQLSHDVGKTPLLINNLVAIAIAQMMNAELLLLIEHSDANYYWALAGLPQPLVDLGPALQHEMNMPHQLFPFLKDAETAERSQDEWRRVMVQGMLTLQLTAGSGGEDFEGWKGELAAAAVMAKLYPVAKEALIAGGMERERVEEMPVGQVVAIHTARSVDYAVQEIFKISLLPYEEAMERMPQVMERLIKEGVLGPSLSGSAGLPIASLLLPAVSNVLQAEIRLASNFAALQAIEAIRMQAAADGGKLPRALADVTVVPVPNNPATGEPFEYSLDAETGEATLEMPPIGRLPPRQDGKRYVIRLGDDDQ
jgi:hypothetical protein